MGRAGSEEKLWNRVKQALASGLVRPSRGEYRNSRAYIGKVVDWKHLRWGIASLPQASEETQALCFTQLETRSPSKWGLHPKIPTPEVTWKAQPKSSLYRRNWKIAAR